MEETEVSCHIKPQFMAILRWYAYRVAGGNKDFGPFVMMHGPVDGKPSFDWGFIYASHQFPQLYWHIDFDGTYTRRGRLRKVDGNSVFTTGNSLKLLKELRVIRGVTFLRNDPRWVDFERFVDDLERVVSTGDGVVGVG